MGVANGKLRVVPILPPSSNENAILEGARDAQGRLNGRSNRSPIRFCRNVLTCRKYAVLRREIARKRQWSLQLPRTGLARES